MSVEAEKRLAAQAAADMVRDGMRVGLGTGTTVAYLLAALAQRLPKVVYVATSPHTEHAARSLGLVVETFDELDHLDLAIDGADQIARSGWLIKGGGGAHTREKIVAASAERFVVIADSTKSVDELRAPVPLELHAFGLAATLRRLTPTSVRDVALSPDGGVIADYRGEISEPATLAASLSMTPGVIEHGLFSPNLTSEILIAKGATVHRTIGGTV
ncbi:MAG: ribose-5-phosphate isomerase RpiA [Acidobacteria bacterium]|nr:ribose-5-phosphate isomerase RpiA [Acidobacteriota bacterium]